MKGNSTLRSSTGHFVKRKITSSKQKDIRTPREESINMILSYSRSLTCISTKSVGDIFVLNN